MTIEELRCLHQRVHEANAHVQRPFEPGETSRPIEFFTDHLGEKGWHLGWRMVGALRDFAADLFASYGESGLHRAALEAILQAEEPPTLDEIADRLREEASNDAGPWVVVIPLANVSLDRAWAPLGDRAALQRAAESVHIEDPEERRALEETEYVADRAVFEHLGDRLPPASRMIQAHGRLVDTGRAVSLISVEQGPPLIAIEAARAKALYALASWAVLSPPTDWRLIADIAVWTPQPALHQRTVHKRFEEGQWVSRERRRGGDYREWGPYELPDDGALAAPFEAFARLDRRSATALLSGTAAVHAGMRATRSQISERVRDVRTAVLGLCEPPPGVRGTADDRWHRLADRFRVWDHVADARAYTAQQIEDLQSRLEAARNISAHRSEAALIDLGWARGGGSMRGRGRTAAENLTATALHRDLGAMLFALGEALRGTWAVARDTDFDDTAFEALFA
jgi:hypothetical protein